MLWPFAGTDMLRNIICTSALAVFIVAFSSALSWLSRSVEFSNFMIFGVLGIALMVSLGYAFDYWQSRSQRSQR
jgi:uncharacterized membrane protein YfcA